MNPTLLSEKEYKYIWDWMYSELSFKPSVRSSDWPSIRTKMPFYKFSIDFLWQGSYDEDLHIRFLNKAINTFIEITQDGETIYALDWQHECFFYDPRELTIDALLGTGSNIPSISFIPEGDYYIFISKNHQSVWFGHPWEKSVTLIGEILISSAAKNGLPVK